MLIIDGLYYPVEQESTKCELEWGILLLKIGKAK